MNKRMKVKFAFWRDGNSIYKCHVQYSDKNSNVSPLKNEIIEENKYFMAKNHKIDLLPGQITKLRTCFRAKSLKFNK